MRPTGLILIWSDGTHRATLDRVWAGACAAPFQGSRRVSRLSAPQWSRADNVATVRLCGRVSEHNRYGTAHRESRWRAMDDAATLRRKAAQCSEDAASATADQANKLNELALQLVLWAED